MKLELAKAGNHNGIIITEEDLQEMAETFRGDVPVTIGHEMDDTMPAYGWVKSLSVSADGQTLIGELEPGAELEQAIADGRYKNWSIGAGRDADDRMYLHHVAFLGAVPPMIKDLKMIEMGDRSEIATFAIAPQMCRVMLSDEQTAEYTSLKLAKRNEKLTKLSDVTAGKLPFGKREELLQFAAGKMDEKGGEEFADFLTDIFSSVKSPVKAGLSQHITSKRAEAFISFSKI